MTKIRNFRVALRAREIGRWIRRERGIESTPDMELEIEKRCREVVSRLEPAAVFTTLTRSVAEKTTSLEFPKGAIAVSIMVASIGPKLAAREIPGAEGTFEEALGSALVPEALAQALNFVQRLVQDQAKDEECELSELSGSESPSAALAKSLALLVGVQRIGLDLDAADSQIPEYARVAWVYWMPSGRKSGGGKGPGKAGSFVGKPAAADRRLNAEKAVA